MRPMKAVVKISRAALGDACGKLMPADTLFSEGSNYETQEGVQIIECVPSEGILLAQEALVKKGDTIICMQPGYQSLFEVSRAKGAKVVAWEPRMIDLPGVPCRWEFDIDELIELFKKHKASGLVVNAPHNPTGFRFEPYQRNRIAAIAQKYNSWVLSDEMYMDIVDPRPNPTDPNHYSGFAGLPNCIVLSGLSKP